MQKVIKEMKNKLITTGTIILLVSTILVSSGMCLEPTVSKKTEQFKISKSLTTSGENNWFQFVFKGDLDALFYGEGLTKRFIPIGFGYMKPYVFLHVVFF